MDTAHLAHSYLLYYIFPLWIIAGFGDYLFHRATNIGQISGLKESLIHFLMIVESES